MKKFLSLILAVVMVAQFLQLVEAVKTRQGTRRIAVQMERLVS